jgi:uncharacterized protein (DUF1684 family)
MKKIILVALIFLTVSCADNEYKNAVLQWRALKNENFKNPETSPLSKIEIKKFKGLNYFEVNPKFKFQAKLTKENYPKYIRLFKDDKVEEVHQLSGKVEFLFNNKMVKLSVFTSINQAPNKLFIPFKDLTNGVSTYSGGKYIEAEIINDSTCTIDFNFSYHPFCAYNEKFTCPIPPFENFINDSIIAGERN